MKMKIVLCLLLLFGLSCQRKIVQQDNPDFICLPTVEGKAYVKEYQIKYFFDNPQDDGQKSTVWLDDGRVFFCILSADEIHDLLYPSKENLPPKETAGKVEY